METVYIRELLEIKKKKIYINSQINLFIYIIISNYNF